MTLPLKVTIAIVSAFAIGMLMAPIVIAFGRRLKLGQTVLSYVELHKAKSGTPTFGGLIFLFASIAVACCFNAMNGLALYAVLISLSFAALGFMDDYIKVKYKQNCGLKPIQKIVGQLGIALIAAMYCYRHPLIGSKVYIPFTAIIVDFGIWYIPFAVLAIIATTNAVNLTDGLDGLAGRSMQVYLLGMLLICLSVYFVDGMYFGQTALMKETANMTIYIGCLFGAIMAFLWKNSYPAKVFMGDTGSLALGSLAVTIPLFLQMPFLVVISGGVFVFTCISVILQVIYYKSSGKRIFLMAPFHHHLELKGMHESNIVAKYSIVSTLFTVVGIICAILRFNS